MVWRLYDGDRADSRLCACVVQCAGSDIVKYFARSESFHAYRMEGEGNESRLAWRLIVRKRVADRVRLERTCPRMAKVRHAAGAARRTGWTGKTHRSGSQARRAVPPTRRRSPTPSRRSRFMYFFTRSTTAASPRVHNPAYVLRYVLDPVGELFCSDLHLASDPERWVLPVQPVPTSPAPPRAAPSPFAGMFAPTGPDPPPAYAQSVARRNLLLVPLALHSVSMERLTSREILHNVAAGALCRRTHTASYQPDRRRTTARPSPCAHMEYSDAHEDGSSARPCLATCV